MAPALTILNDSRLASGAGKEFAQARAELKLGTPEARKQVLVESACALESTMKVLLQQRKIAYDLRDTAQKLFEHLRDNGVIAADTERMVLRVRDPAEQARRSRRRSGRPRRPAVRGRGVRRCGRHRDRLPRQAPPVRAAPVAPARLRAQHASSKTGQVQSSVGPLRTSGTKAGAGVQLNLVVLLDGGHELVLIHVAVPDRLIFNHRVK